MAPRPPARRAKTPDKQQARTHVHCSIYAPSDARLAAGFRCEGTDVAIRLDLPKMLSDKVAIFKSKADVLLLPDAVGPQFILTIQASPHGVTLYRRPAEQQLMGASCYDQMRRPCLRAGMAHRHLVLS